MAMVPKAETTFRSRLRSPVPVVKLKKEHYQHKSYGRIFTPVFEIVNWVSLDGAAEPAAEEAPVAEEAAPQRRRRSV